MTERHGAGATDLTLHGGAGPTRVQWYFREDTTLPVAVQRWEIPPGGSEGRHVHPPGEHALEELYVLIEGRATMYVDGTVHDLAPGDAVLAPVGSDHDVANPGPATAVLMVIWGPPGRALDWRAFASGRAAEAAARGDG